MDQIRPILLVVGILLTVIGVAMLIPTLVDLLADHEDWQVFLVSSGATLFIGGGLWITNAVPVTSLTLRQAFLLTTITWIVVVMFAAVPLYLCGLGLSVTDAVFEAMSGLTTTGSTVIVGLDDAPPGVLMWRALLQWLGGVGIIVMAIAVLPMLQVGGMQLFHLESSDRSDKILPRATQFVASIAAVYGLLTLACAVGYMAAGMGNFDAVAHAMTTVATGGYSTKDASFGHFDSGAADYVAVVFMIAGGLPFTLYLLALRGSVGAILRDPQVRLFMALLTLLVSAMTVYQIAREINAPGEAVRYAAFNVVSVMTGTGYATTDYGAWGAYAVTVFFFTMFIGGCAGSTSCGVKIFRVHVLWAAAEAEVRRLTLPHGVFTPRYGGRPLGQDVISSVTAFLFLFLILFGALSLALGLMGLDPLTAISASATALANVGPGLGDVVGPSGSFASLPEAAKWLLSLGMLLGRLELFTVLVMFTPRFWQ
ncbi:MAG: TrkH family potassium uptake protein [Alphaproteobacteria bacterium]